MVQQKDEAGDRGEEQGDVDDVLAAETDGGAADEPCSLPAAISEPVVVSAPRMTSKPRAVMRSRPRPRAVLDVLEADQPAASAPKAWESAVRCGMAVMGTQMAMSVPMAEPTTRPAMIQSR